jgi:DNA-binding NarL/FixJ family response regulator
VADRPLTVADDSIRPLAEQILARRGRAWLLTAPVGVDTSARAAEVAAALRTMDLDVLEVFALTALREIPLGAMLPLLAEADRAAPDVSAQERLQALFARLSRGTARTVVVVHDVSNLDEVSAAAVHQLVRAYGVRGIVTARLGAPLPSAIADLEDAGLVERVSVAGLDDTAAAAVVERFVGGPATPESLVELLGRAGGNPLFLRLLLEDARVDGLIGAPEGGRGIPIGTVVVPTRIRALVAEWSASLSISARATLERIAIAHRLPRARVDDADLARLRELGLVAVDGVHVRPAFPVAAESVLADVSAPGLDRRRIETADLLDDLDGDDDRLARIGALAWSSQPPATAEVAWAAQAATGHGRHGDAVRLAERADALAREREEARPLEAILLRGESLWLLGRYEEADAAFLDALGAYADDAGIALAASRASQYWAVRRQDPDRAAAIEAAAIEAIRSPEARAFLLTSTAKWRIMIGEAVAVPTASAPIGSSPAVAAAAALDPALVGALTSVLAGAPDDARRAVAAGRPHAAAAEPIVRHATELFDYVEAVLPALDGNLDESHAAVAARAGRRLGEGAGMWTYALAFLDYHAGRYREASDQAAVAVDQLAWRDLAAVRGAALGLRAAAAAQLGERRTASAALRELDTAMRRIVIADLQAAEAESWLAWRPGSVDSAAPLERAVAAAAGTGHGGWMAFAAHAAIRQGQPSGVLRVLHAESPRPPAAIFGLVVDHAVALERDDAAALLRAAQALAAAGLRAGARDAARQALAAARAARLPDLARRARVAASRMGAGLAVDAGGRIADVLTGREWDVASAAADRERNREIAERLGLSLRTVENHLASAYRKLGVGGRDELRALLDEEAST